MCVNRSVFIISVLLFGLICQSKSYLYRTVLEDPELFNDCENQPENTLGIYGLFDFSEFNFNTETDPQILTGNCTTIWDIQPTDRIESAVSIYKFDRGTWEPTTFAIKVSDFCKVMHNKYQYWYTNWMRYVINRDEVKDRCLLPGTKFVHMPFTYQIDFDANTNLEGRYKLVIKFQAIDQENVMRPTSICFETKFEFMRI